MAVDTRDVELRIVRTADGLDLDLDPLQGLWTEAQYLRLTDQTNHLIEWTDGVLEVLPMPTRDHQRISALLYRALFTFVSAFGGIVLYSPLRLQIRPGAYREPDLLVLLDENDPRNGNDYWRGADLVIEIVSPDRPQRDLLEKPLNYAAAGIPEYWIVNPLDSTFQVLTLTDDGYSPRIFRSGDQATSAVLPSFSIAVDQVFLASV